MNNENTEQDQLDEKLKVALDALRLIATQGGDIVEPWSAEMARRALREINE